LSAYEQLIDFYLKLQEGYHCLPSQIDEQQIDIIIDELIVLAKKDEAENTLYIDEII